MRRVVGLGSQFSSFPKFMWEITLEIYHERYDEGKDAHRLRSDSMECAKFPNRNPKTVSF